MNNRTFWTTVFLLLFSATCWAQYRSPKLVEHREFFVSHADKDLGVKSEVSKKDSHSFSIERKFNGEKQEELIRIAEAIYPQVTGEEKHDFDPNKESEYEADRRKEGGYVKPIESKPYWSSSNFDGVKISKIISQRSIAYYRDLVLRYRTSQPVPYRMNSTELTYIATVNSFGSTQVAGKTYENVSVVTLKIKWTQYCGSLCAGAFNTEKVVVFDRSGKPIALFIPDYIWSIVS